MRPPELVGVTEAFFGCEESWELLDGDRGKNPLMFASNDDDVSMVHRAAGAYVLGDNKVKLLPLTPNIDDVFKCVIKRPIKVSSFHTEVAGSSHLAAS
jgi:hypothetical protein